MANRLSDFFPKSSVAVKKAPATKRKRIYSPKIETEVSEERFYDPNKKGYFSEQSGEKKKVYNTEYYYDADENWRKNKKKK